MKARRCVHGLAGLVLLLGCVLSPAGWAHELTPGYLGLTERQPDRYDVQWKLSTSGGLETRLDAELPAGCVAGERLKTLLGDGNVWRWQADCPGGLRGQSITIAGLDDTRTDVLLRIDYLDGTSLTRRLTPDDATALIPQRASLWDVSVTYLGLGIEHILIGVDHLLFVLALLLLVDGVRRLIATITAFTVAHSLTLGAATLGWVHVPPAPVEAVIALSILFLAVELGRDRTAGADLARRYPWLVAFSFGLLHGFGFAGALADVGLPERAIPLALLFFNIGVEIGQLLFIAAVLLAGRLLTQMARRTATQIPSGWTRAVAYGIGAVSAFWVIERTASALALT